MAESGEFRVWIDQDLCTGDGLCVEIVPKIFVLNDDGLAYVMDERGVFDGSAPERPKGGKGLVYFAQKQFDDVYEASVECPGECIFIEDPEGNSAGPYAPSN